MKIAVIGFYFDLNLGDRIICECVSQWLQKAYLNAEVDIIDITGKKECYLQEYPTMMELRIEQVKYKFRQVKGCLRKQDIMYNWCKTLTDSRKEFYDEVTAKAYDCAVFAGGQMFMDGLALDVCEFLKRWKENGTPVFFNACGVGPMRSKKIEDVLRQHLVLDNIRLISSRDNVELINTHFLNGEKKAVETFDPALWTRDSYQFHAKSQKTVGLGVMYCSTMKIKAQVRFWIDVIHELNKRQIAWRMFGNGAPEDYVLGEYILNKMKLDTKLYLLPRPETPENLIGQIASFSSIISFRLHSHIIAASLRVPGVAIVWDDKLKFFYKHLKCEERCMTIDTSGKDVVNMLIKAQQEGWNEKLLQSQQEYSRQLLLSEIEKEWMDE